MSKPGKTERALTAIAMLPIGEKWRRRASTMRDMIKGVRLLRALMRGDEE